MRVDHTMLLSFSLLFLFLHLLLLVVHACLQLDNAGKKEAVPSGLSSSAARGKGGGGAGKKDQATARTVSRRRAQSLVQPRALQPFHPQRSTGKEAAAHPGTGAQEVGGGALEGEMEAAPSGLQLDGHT
jgi:hypothetical protein